MISLILGFIRRGCGLLPPEGTAKAINRTLPAKQGFMLLTVLIITAVGLLFGAGALLLFRFQCQIRIERQHELEKVYAVRSALNYIRTKSDIPDSGKSFRYYTGSERNLGLLVKPVEPIFPAPKSLNQQFFHFFMKNSAQNGGFKIPCNNQYNEDLDYEYGVRGVTNNYDLTKAMESKEISARDGYGLAFTDTAETNNVKWWINIGMRGTGGWLQSDYGRRYYFYLKNYVGSSSSSSSDTILGDVIRLCIIKNVTNDYEGVSVGCKHGWPLLPGERALMLEIRPSRIMMGKQYGGQTGMTLYECCYGQHPQPLLARQFNDALCYMGLQIAQRKMTIFYISTSGGGGPNVSPYTFLNDESVEMSQPTYDYFSRGSEVVDGRIVKAPELRAVLEVEAASNLRDGTVLANNVQNVLTDFRVTPAYQYDVFLEHPVSVTNRATVAQKVRKGKYSQDGTENAVRTYDTHGTDNKGFRKDEKLARGNGK